VLKIKDPLQLGKLSLWKVRLTKVALIVVDMISFFLAGDLAGILVSSYKEVQSDLWLESQDAPRYMVWLGVVLYGLIVFLVRSRRYTERKPFWTELGETLNVLVMLAMMDLALVAIARWNSSRLWWVLVWSLTALFLPLGRGMLCICLRRMRLWQRPTIVIGGGPNAYDAIAAIQSEPALGFEVLSIASPNDVMSEDGGALLQSWAGVPGVQFVLALEAEQSEAHEAVLQKLAGWHVEDVSVIPAMRGVPLFGTDISYFFAHEVALLKLRNNLRYWPIRIGKRVFDLFGAFILLIIGAFPMLYIGWLIRRDGGPAIFAHQRIGRSGKIFPCFKFRTMHVDADLQLRQLLSSDSVARDEWNREFKLRKDPRITRIGKFLRQTSLDELPQLFNVIRGEMSLVGPRPIVQAELERYGDNAHYFLMVRPGMTGLWQINGRSDISYDTRVYLDTWYVKNWSLWYDVAILFKTVRVVFQGKGAY